MTPPRYKVAIADDHPLYRQMLRQVLTNAIGFDVVIEAPNGRILLDELNKTSAPDILILDLQMPVMNGIDVLRTLKSQRSSTKVLMISGYTDDAMVLQLRSEGAQGFVNKSATDLELLYGLQHITTFSTFFSGSVKFDSAAQPGGPVKLQELRTNELIFLRLLCAGNTYAGIAKTMHLSIHTVHDYRDRLFNKFDVQTQAALIIKSVKMKIIDLDIAF